MIVRFTCTCAVTMLGLVLWTAAFVSSACESPRSSAAPAAPETSLPALDMNAADGAPAETPRDASSTTPATPRPEAEEEPPLGLPPKQVPAGEHPQHRVPAPDQRIPEKVPPGEPPR